MNIEAINIFGFDGPLTTETLPKFWALIKKFRYNSERGIYKTKYK